jgi:Domain of unknown function (DUF3332)
MGKAARLIAFVLVFTVMVLSMASCAGQFALTHKLLNWNLSLNKWVGSLLMFLFIIIPVYGVCMLVDYIVLNIIEFYSGSNPMTSEAEVNGSKVAMKFHEGDGINVDITSVAKDGTVKTMAVRTTPEGMTARVIENGQASKITAAWTEDGMERCVDGNCEEIDSGEMLAQAAKLGLETVN